ncbi:uncharacterized protein LOC144104505 [Amblyomma americanum]
MPTADSMEEHMRDFFAVSAFPHAVGALDGCHFPVSPPEEHASDYINYKGCYLSSGQVICNVALAFRVDIETTRRCIHETCQAILERLKDHFMQANMGRNCQRFCPAMAVSELLRSG